MTDRELLELAAKAAGIIPVEGDNRLSDGVFQYWNPLTNDGDALRLAVKRSMEVVNQDNECFVATLDENQVRVYHGADPYAATRRAIVLAAAAEVEKEMK